MHAIMDRDGRLVTSRLNTTSVGVLVALAGWALVERTSGACRARSGLLAARGGDGLLRLMCGVVSIECRDRCPCQLWLG